MNLQSAEVLKQLFIDSSWDYKEVKNRSLTGSNFCNYVFIFKRLMIYNVNRDYYYKLCHFYSLLSKNERLDL